MRFKCRFLKKKFLLLLITIGIGSALNANDELKSLADSLRRMIDEKPLFIQQKEQRINRIKCLLKGSGLTLEQKYKINFQLCNEYKKFVVDSAIHYVDQNLDRKMEEMKEICSHRSVAGDKTGLEETRYWIDKKLSAVGIPHEFQNVENGIALISASVSG